MNIKFKSDAKAIISYELKKEEISPREFTERTEKIHHGRRKERKFIRIREKMVIMDGKR